MNEISKDSDKFVCFNSYVMYCWGSTANGELGLGGIEDENILCPRPLVWNLANKVSYIACGYSHSLLVTTDGQIYSCGNNDYGQLGHDQPRKRPRMSLFSMWLSALIFANTVGICIGVLILD